MESFSVQKVRVLSNSSPVCYIAYSVLFCYRVVLGDTFYYIPDKNLYLLFCQMHRGLQWHKNRAPASTSTGGTYATSSCTTFIQNVLQALEQKLHGMLRLPEKIQYFLLLYKCSNKAIINVIISITLIRELDKNILTILSNFFIWMVFHACVSTRWRPINVADRWGEERPLASWPASQVNPEIQCTSTSPLPLYLMGTLLGTGY